jgi:hypothetical protein
MLHLYCQDQAGPHRIAIHDDGAGTAGAVGAADMRACEAKIVPYAISQRGAWLNLHLNRLAIDIECYVHDGCSGFGGGAGQGALHKGGEQGATIAGGAVNVVGWIDDPCCHLGGRRYGVRIDGAAIQHGFRSG